MTSLYNFIRLSSFKDLLKIFLFASLLFHLLCALFSSGPHRWDEYDGITTNTAYLLGYVDQTELHPHETKHHIRPWLQPALYYSIIKPFDLLGLTNPFYQASILRIFSSLLGWLSLFYLSKLIPFFLRNLFQQKVSLLTLCFLWPLPFFHARMTSENLATSFFVFGFYLIVKNLLMKNKDQKLSCIELILSGLYFAAAFSFRNQIAVMIAFLALWLVVFGKISLKSFLRVTLSFLFFEVIFILLDSYIVGQLHFSAFNNWTYNVLMGVASSFGVDPWYRYFTKGFLKFYPPVSFFVLLGFIFFWIRNPKHVLTWITLSFLVVHSLIGHKELRFIYPLLPFSAFVVPSFISSLPKNRFWNGLLSFTLILNFALLTVSVFIPANTRMGFYKHLYQNSVSKLYVYKYLPKKMIFYTKEKRLESHKIESLEEITNQESFWIVTNKLGLREELIQKMSYCKTIYDSYPYIFYKRLPKKIRERSTFLSLHHCSKEQ